MLNENIQELADTYESYMINCRRTIHTFAEIATQEQKTKQFILDQARELNLPYEEVPTTSCIIKLDTGRPGLTVALRADIDALPMKECPNNLTGPRTCISEQPDTCHGCGHDAHTAMLLGAMKILCEMREQLNGVILFCFEEGEEPNTGVEALLKALEKYQVDKIWAIHVYASLEEGKINVSAGPRMAGACVPSVKFIGKSGHGSRPDLAVNPLFCGVSFLNNLCTAFCNELTPGEIVTLGLTKFHTGTAANIIDDTAEIEGTFRFFNEEEGLKAKTIFKRVAEYTAGMHNCQVKFPSIFDFFAHPVINDRECAATAQNVLNELFPEGTLTECGPWYASESFSRWLRKYPGVLVFLGIYNPEQGYGAQHHNDRFDLNESVLKKGAMATARYAAEYLIRNC